MAAGLVLAMPGSADAKERFRPCGEASCGVLSVPLDHSGAVPGRLSLRVKRYPSFDPGPHGLVLVLAGAPGEAAFETENLLLESPGHDLVRFDQALHSFDKILQVLFMSHGRRLPSRPFGHKSEARGTLLAAL